MKNHLLAMTLALATLAPGCPARPGPLPPDNSGNRNPLLGAYDTPFGAPPFHRLRPEHFLPAFNAGMKRHRKEIDDIIKQSAAPTFANTVEAMDRSGELLIRVVRTFYGLYGANTTPALNKLAKKMLPALTKHQDDILLSEPLFKRVAAVYAKRESLGLNAEQKNLVSELYQDFVRGGARLAPAKKKTLRSLNKQLSLLQLTFRQNLLAETNRFKLVVIDRKDLAGLPDRVVAAAAKAAKARGLAGKWVFTLHKPSLIPFLQHSERRALREKMLKGYNSRGDHGDKLDNKKVLVKIVTARIQKAKLLGYATYADFKLSRRMAQTPAKVRELLDRIWKVALPAAKKEARALQAQIAKEGKTFKLQPWDWWYYAEKERRARYALDDKQLRPYFKLDNVLGGAFEVAKRLYGIRFKELKNVPLYHPEVRTFEVTEADGRHLGVFYIDYHPRKSKRGGAWCGGFRSQTRKAGKRISPLVTNVGNFTSPSQGKPALLSFNEVRTLFHEFGHALQSLLTDVTYAGSHESIKVDFVELPSQVMENWAAEPEVLKLYARHYQTGKPIPEALVKKIAKSRTFNQGFVTVEYMSACYLDLAWHELSAPPSGDVTSFEKAALGKIGLLPEIVVRYRSTYFAHVFAGDFYSAGYYSYIWAQVLDADAFEAFKKNGLFDQKTARSFRKNILGRSGAEHPMTLYKRFRGAEPGIAPLLRRKGLLTR